MKRLTEEIKQKNFKRIYLLYGEEEYLLRQFTMNLSNAIVPASDTMNRAEFIQQDADPAAILEAANTLPFFAEHKLILLKDTGFFKKCPDLLFKGLSGLPETTVMVFSEHETDKRGRLYKYVKKNEGVTEFGRQSPQVLAAWVRKMAKESGYAFRPEALSAFLERVGNDMDHIASEAEKLFAYCLGSREIRTEDVDAVCSDVIEAKVFELIDAAAGGDRDLAMSRYAGLLILREPPMRIIALFTRQFHILMRLKDMQAAGYGQQQIAAALKIPSFAVRKNARLAARFSQKQLECAFRACIKADESVKTGTCPDRTALELLIAGLLQ